MLKFLTSLTFLYAFTITVLFIYGWIYYKSFARNRSQKKGFPVVFALIGLACLSFLYFNIHAPLSLKTFSNLDHHFIQHDGFRVAGSIEMGRTDTVNFKGNNFNRFILKRSKNQLQVQSPYSEEPLYVAAGNSFKIVSVNFPAEGQALSFQTAGAAISLRSHGDKGFQLSINDSLVCTSSRKVTKAAAAWTVLKDEVDFVNSPLYTNERLVGALKNIFLLRDEVSREEAGPFKFYVSGKLFRYANEVRHDDKVITTDQIAFTASIPDRSLLAWGIGFLDNNKSQFRVQFLGADSFALLNRYPVSYPLTEEEREDWSMHKVNKFLVSDPADMQQMPSVFGEGYLFAPFRGDKTIDFSPVLLNYQKSRANAPLQLQAAFMERAGVSPVVTGNKILLPAVSSGFSWVFSIQNSFHWNFGKKILDPLTWQLLLFGALFIFFAMVLLFALVQPASRQSWIWQLLSAVTLVLLTTRFFLYWRYKSFPPFEGLDLPSQQQLNSFWNFGIILLVTVVLGILFGYGLFRHIYVGTRKMVASLFRRSYNPAYNESTLTESKLSEGIGKIGIVKRKGVKFFYFLSWVLILVGGGAYAAINDFDPATCRHLAIVLVLFYFLFIYISYKNSPLVAASEKSWWGIRTGKTSDIIINNPVKVLLSVSLLALFAFIDIGFAIIFLNFLLFNEAFLCINFAIAGLSAGSKRNASLFSLLAFIYLALFALNLVYGPYVFNFLLGMSRIFYIAGYMGFAILMGYMLTRLMPRSLQMKRTLIGIGSAVFLFVIAFLFFPREKILEKAAMTKYRIDVMTMPVDEAIEIAYEEGKTYEPVIRAAQNQWFINTFIFEKNNPGVQKAGFQLLPHAPQSKGAKYNAQATDLVASRFLIAEHGKWSVLLYVLLLLVPGVLIASFYKLYPDFTNRINTNYPTVTTGFSLLNYLLITALLVILAATGRYIFFGQDLPFGSILSKQSVVFPAIIIVAVVMLFKRIPLEQYPNRKKLVPGIIVFTGLALLLFLVKPDFNKDREFGASDIARQMDNYIESNLQPIFDHFDTSKSTRRLSMAKKDGLFSDSLKVLLDAGLMEDAGKFFSHEIRNYTRADFSRHLDQRKLVYLDLYTGRPRLAVNDNFFRVDPPPHLRELWKGNVFSDSTTYNVSLWNGNNGGFTSQRISSYASGPATVLTPELSLVFKTSYSENIYGQLALVNRSSTVIQVKQGEQSIELGTNDTMLLANPSKMRIRGKDGTENWLVVEPDAFMKNYYVNGNRFYVYPMGPDFIWARNFSESIASEFSSRREVRKNAFISLDAILTDSLTARIRSMVLSDTAYKKGAEYGISIADGNGRLVAMADFIKGLDRPDPNDKAAFNKVIRGDDGYISQSLLRKEIGNINLLRMNPGPGSTLKPIIFTAIASQLKLDWDAFAAEGFSGKQQFFGGEKVSEYDFEKNNGRISSVVDYLRHSDNYYHSNLLLLGSYSKQSLQTLLSTYFASQNPEPGFHWPYFSYNGKQYWLDGFKNWPGYVNGKANFGSDSSFVSIGLFNNFRIYTFRSGEATDRFSTAFDSLLFQKAARRSGFILPEYALFDQKGTGMDNRKPNEVFMSSFRGHVKGSSQVMIPPVKMLDAFGKMISQNRNYGLTLNPYAVEPAFEAFDVDNGVTYSNYLTLIREKVWEGMKQALYTGTAARLGAMLKEEKEYYYYAKTGTTGDDDVKAKSKLFTIVISKKDVTDPDFNFRKNKFYTIYFTSQNGPAKQNEEFQAAIIKYVQESAVFNRYMKLKN